MKSHQQALLMAAVCAFGVMGRLVSLAQTPTIGVSDRSKPEAFETANALASFEAWTERYAGTTDAHVRGELLKEGITLAKARRTAFLDFIASDPRKALERSVPAARRGGFPVQINDELEGPFLGTGDLLCLCEMPAKGSRAMASTRRLVRINGHTYRAYVYGRRLYQTTKYHIPLHGVVLDGAVALNEKVLADVEAGPNPGLTKPAARLSSRTEVPDGSATSVLARLGHATYRFESPEHRQQMEALLETAESAIGPEPFQPASELIERGPISNVDGGAAQRPNTPSCLTIGKKRILVVRIDFPDLPGDPRPIDPRAGPYTADHVQQLADTLIAPYFERSSYGRSTVVFTVTPQLYRMPSTAAFYATTGFEFRLYDDAVAAVAADYRLSDYFSTVVLFSWLGDLPGSQIRFGGQSWIGTSKVWVNGEFDFRVVAHELGHACGLWHANLWQVNDGNPISDTGVSTKYGDPFDTMGANWGNDSRTDFNPFFKHQLDWIQDHQVRTVTGSGTFRLYRFDQVGAGEIMALRVRKDGERDYWIGHRRSFAGNATLEHGAYIIWGHNQAHSDLLDMTTPGQNPLDAGLAIGATLADAKSGITIAPVAEGGIAPHEYLDVEVTFGPPPIIVSQPQAQVIGLNQAAEFTVEAEGIPPPSFIWQRRPADTASWVTLRDGSGCVGASTATLVITCTSSWSSGDAVRCVLTNSAGGFNCTEPALLTVLPCGVTTLAGKPGQAGHTDGFGRLARFNEPTGVAVDLERNLCVADGGNHCIRRITPAGLVSTLAGLAGTPGSIDGCGSDARFNTPVGVAIDREGNVYVADRGNSTIRKISTGGVVCTLAGVAGSAGSADGTGSEARFNSPTGIAVDATGNLYVVDQGNSTIRLVTSAGVVRTLAGMPGKSGSSDGIGSEARFNYPAGVAVDAVGNLYVADQNNSTIREITSQGVVSTLAGMPGCVGNADGIGSLARFNYPAGIAVDGSGIIYVANRNDSTIRIIAPGALVSTLAGVSGTDGSTDGDTCSAQFTFPTAVTVDLEGTVYVADTYAHTIRLVRTTPTLRPVLHVGIVGSQVIVSWPLSASNFVLETRQALSNVSAWTLVTNNIAISDDTFVLARDIDAPVEFFRLRTK